MGKHEPNMHIDEHLLAQAQTLGVSAESIAEDAIRAAVAKADPAAADERAHKWAEENAEAIADYNRRIRERGTIGAEFRKW
jgi:antitoxin CcdA